MKEDLGLDSLETAELIMQAEELFDTNFTGTFPSYKDMPKVRELVDYVQKKLNES